MSRQIPNGDAPLSGDVGAKQPVWDLPVRLVHWGLAGLIAFSWWSIHNHHRDWHIWSGCAILTLLIFRLLWGLFGSSTARFTSFVRGPRAVKAYLRGDWSGIGHSPLAAISVVALFGATFVQVALGLISEDEDGIYFGPLARLVSTDASDRAAAIHAVWFKLLLTLIIVHVCAIVIYRLRGREMIGPMITGRAPLAPGTEPMRQGKWGIALVSLAVSIAVTRWVIAGAPPFGS